MSSQKILTLSPDPSAELLVPNESGSFVGHRVAGDLHEFVLTSRSGKTIGKGETPVDAIVEALAGLQRSFEQAAREAELARMAFVVLQQQIIIVDTKIEMLEERTLRGRVRRFGNWLMSWTTFVSDEVDPVADEAPAEKSS